MSGDALFTLAGLAVLVVGLGAGYIFGRIHEHQLWAEQFDPSLDAVARLARNGDVLVDVLPPARREGAVRRVHRPYDWSDGGS